MNMSRLIVRPRPFAWDACEHSYAKRLKQEGSRVAVAARGEIVRRAKDVIRRFCLDEDRLESFAERSSSRSWWLSGSWEAQMTFTEEEYDLARERIAIARELEQAVAKPLPESILSNPNDLEYVDVCDNEGVFMGRIMRWQISQSLHYRTSYVILLSPDGQVITENKVGFNGKPFAGGKFGYIKEDAPILDQCEIAQRELTDSFGLVISDRRRFIPFPLPVDVKENRGIVMGNEFSHFFVVQLTEQELAQMPAVHDRVHRKIVVDYLLGLFPRASVEASSLKRFNLFGLVDEPKPKSQNTILNEWMVKMPEAVISFVSEVYPRIVIILDAIFDGGQIAIVPDHFYSVFGNREKHLVYLASGPGANNVVVGLDDYREVGRILSVARLDPPLAGFSWIETGQPYQALPENEKIAHMAFCLAELNGSPFHHDRRVVILDVIMNTLGMNGSAKTNHAVIAGQELRNIRKDMFGGKLSAVKFKIADASGENWYDVELRVDPITETLGELQTGVLEQVRKIL